MYQCNLLNWPFWGVPCGFSVSQLGTIQVNGIIILGSGLGRDSEYLPKGVVKMEYTVRLNNVGDFALPPSRVEALYAPEMFGETPNARVGVQAAK